jgi:imidazolonepropionase-like amidohydrolase
VRGTLLPSGERRDLWLVGDRVSFTPVAGALTIADSGFILPGLVDAHCHLGIQSGGRPSDSVDAARSLAVVGRDAGVLAIRDAGSPISYPSLDDDPEVPRLARAGRHVAPPKRYLRDIGVEVGETDLPGEITRQAANGNGWVKLVGDWIDRGVGDLAPLWTDEELAQAIKVAHDAGARVTAHVFGEDALPGLINAGIDCIEHGTGLTDDTISLMAARGTALVPTLINIETFPGIADRAGKYPAYANHMRELHARVSATVASAIEAGVPVYAGTDAGGGIQHGRIVDEIISLHRVGMSASDAIGAASWHAREWLGFPSLVEGAAADIVVYDEDPRENLDVLRTPRMIMLRGRIH